MSGRGVRTCTHTHTHTRYTHWPLVTNSNQHLPAHMVVTISIESIGCLHNKCNLYRKYRMFTKQCNFVWCGWTEGRVDLIEKTIY